VGTFVGRDSNKNVEESLKDFKRVFTDLVKYAEDCKVKIAIENCPMFWEDRCPGGNNLAAIWFGNLSIMFRRFITFEIEFIMFMQKTLALCQRFWRE